MKKIISLLFVLNVFIAAGCNDLNADKPYLTPERKENGLILILPGIEGESGFNHDIMRGLERAGNYRAMMIYHWGRPVPLLGMVLNQMDVLGNRLAGKSIAELVEHYQDMYPNRPVHIIGHSGGGGIAVFAAEELSEGRQVDGLILLSASIAEGYDLTKALRKCKNGIVNFYNPSDGGMLGVGTTIMGTVDGSRGASAGLNGFKRTFPKLYQRRITAGMTMGGGAHSAATKPYFVSTYVAPWVLSSFWPAGSSGSGSYTTGTTGNAADLGKGKVSDNATVTGEWTKE